MNPSIVELLIGERRLVVEIPSAVFDAALSCELAEHFPIASGVSLNMTELLRRMVPAEGRPPTSRQLEYARKIAEDLEIPLPDIALVSTIECSNFIDWHQEQAKTRRTEVAALRAGRNKYVARARNLNRWTIAHERIELGEPPERVAQVLGVTPPTIEKYRESLRAWNATSHDPKELTIVLRLVECIRAGEDPYNTVKALAG